MLSNKEKLKYYLTNNAKNVINIPTNYELLEVDFATSKFLNSLFSYKNIGSTKKRVSTINKDINNGMQGYSHVATSIEFEDRALQKKVVVEEVNEEREVKSEH